MKIIAVFLIIGLLGFALVAFIFPFGRNTPLVDYAEQQYGKSRAWLYIILTIVFLIVIRLFLRYYEVDNPWYEGPK